MVVDVSTHAGGIVLSRPRTLFEQGYVFGSSSSTANYDVSPDGQRFVDGQGRFCGGGRLNVVLNWTEELKARVPLK